MAAKAWAQRQLLLYRCVLSGARAAAAGGGRGLLRAPHVQGADAAVVVLTGYSEGESRDREALGLPVDQAAFLAALIEQARRGRGERGRRAAQPAPRPRRSQTTTPLVLCIISGGAVDPSPAPGSMRVPAILALFNGGMEAGAGAADVLFGAVNPSGALAATVYRAAWAGASDFLDMGLRSGPGRGHRYLTPAAAADYVLYPFGWGLSYTTWAATVTAVSPATISAAALAAGANVSVSVSLRNSGTLAGSRVVIAALSRVDAPAAEAWPVQWLPRAGFAKAHGVAAQAVVDVHLTITARDLSRWDAAAHAFVVQPGAFNVSLLRDGGAAPAVVLTVTPT